MSAFLCDTPLPGHALLAPKENTRRASGRFQLHSRRGRGAAAQTCGSDPLTINIGILSGAFPPVLHPLLKHLSPLLSKYSLVRSGIPSCITLSGCTVLVQQHPAKLGSSNCKNSNVWVWGGRRAVLSLLSPPPKEGAALASLHPAQRLVWIPSRVPVLQTSVNTWDLSHGLKRSFHSIRGDKQLCLFQHLKLPS